jgi:hypothetical protein
MRKLFTKFALLAVLLSPGFFLLAQDTSSMVGVVTDPSGAVIPGVVVTLSNASTGITLTQTTDNQGFYRFASVPPNPAYKVTFAHAGFSTASFSDITLNVGISRTQNARLAVGGESQTVAVSATNEIVTLDTTDATIGNNLDVKQLEALPIYDRSNGITTLFYQQAGVDSNQAAVTGARIDQTDVTLDGLDVNDIAAGTAFAVVATAPVDSVEQFTGSVAGMGAGQGTGSGAQFQMVTKNGTNKFHGNINEYHRDTTTVANTWFNNIIGLRRPPLIHNQFGGDISGPIKRDKLFFYFDWADSRIIQSSQAERTVPLTDFRAGNLNYINDSDPSCDQSSRKNTTPSCITTLTASQIAALDPASIGFDSALISYISTRYPKANDLAYGDGVNTGGYRFNQATPDTRHTYVTRVDYNLTPTQRIYGRFTLTHRDAISSLNEFDTDPVTHPRQDRSYAYVASHVWNIGKNKVNQFTYGDTIEKLNFPDLYNPTGANQYSFSGLSGPFTSYNGQKRRVPIPMFRDDFNWQKGQHAITFGGTFKFIKTNSNLVNNFNFVYAGQQGTSLGAGLDSTVRPAHINSSTTASTIYDSLFSTGLGVIGEIATNYNYDAAGAALAAGSGAPKAYRFFQTELYAGDTWKVTPKLTLSYGVRYQLYSVPYETHGYQSVTTPVDFDTYIADRIAISKSGNTSPTGLPLTSVVLGGKANNGPNLYNPSYKDFAPRFGFAYTPFATQKTVINGSAGIIYDRTVINAINFLQDQISYLFSNTQTNQFGGSSSVDSLAVDGRIATGLTLPASGAPLPTPAALTKPYTPFIDGSGMPYGLPEGDTGFVIDKNLKDPYSIAINFGVQQDLPAHMILKVNYVGRLGRRLLADADASQVIDAPDYSGKSTQTMVEAFADLTKQTRAGKNYTNVTSEPWFENNLGPHVKAPLNTKTARVEYFGGALAGRGDISDWINTLAYYSYYAYGNNYWPTNIGMPAQFGSNTYLTNKGSSNYHGLLVTLDKNMSQGLRFEFNYTWSHSIDNASLSANANSLFSNNGMICDVLQPRACRGDSDFDVRQEISSNFQYTLPVGRGKQFLANASRALDEAIGGWSISGLPAYRTGLAVNVYSDAFLASFDNYDPAIFTGSRSDLKAHVNVDQTSKTVYMFAGGLAGANKVASEFRGPIGLEYGQRNYLRGPGAFFFDAGLAKTFPILVDKLDLKFRADAYNVFNHPVFSAPSINTVGNAGNFGQITGTVTPANGNPARVAQFSLRLEF